MEQKRLGGFIDQDQHEELISALHQDGMTLSGWIRKVVREYILQHKKDERK